MVLNGITQQVQGFIPRKLHGVREYEKTLTPACHDSHKQTLRVTRSYMQISSAYSTEDWHDLDNLTSQARIDGRD